MAVRGIRGATTAAGNSAAAILEATTELLGELISLNRVDPEEVAFAYFTTTADLDAEFPAAAARRLGWLDVPLLCGHDMAVPATNPRAVPRCIRVLLLLNTELPQRDMKHAYLRGASAIKQDLDATRLSIEGARRP